MFDKVLLNDKDFLVTLGFFSLGSIIVRFKALKIKVKASTEEKKLLWKAFMDIESTGVYIEPGNECVEQVIRNFARDVLRRAGKKTPFPEPVNIEHINTETIPSLLKSEELEEFVGRSFFETPEITPFIGSSIICTWVAHETIENDIDTGTQKNLTQVVVHFFPEPTLTSGKVFFEIMRTTPGFLDDSPARPIDNVGDEAFEKEELFVLYKNISFSIRYQPFTRAPRTTENIKVELPLAEKIVLRLSNL